MPINSTCFHHTNHKRCQQCESQHRRLHWIVLGVSLLFWFAMGCAPQGTATLQGDLQVADCQALAQKTPWQLQSTYVKIAIIGPQKAPVAAELRIQMYPGTLTQRDIEPQDLLVISINNPLQIQAGQSIPIEAYEARLEAEPKGSDPSRIVARAIFSLGHTCPTLPHPMTFALQGQLTFTSFTIANDAPIAGNLTLQVGPARPSSPSTDGALQGTFQLTYNPPNRLGDGEGEVSFLPTQ